VPMRRVLAVGVALLLVAACSSSSSPSEGAASRILESAAGAVPAVEHSAAGGIGGLSSLTWVGDAASGADLLASDGGALARSAGFTTVSATLQAEFSGGVTASVAVLDGGGLSRALLLDGGSELGGPVLVTIRAEEDRLLEISSSAGRVVFDAEGEIVEQWDAHSSCRWSHCVGAAFGFLIDLAVWDALYWVLATSCGLATDPDTVWTCEVTCALCIAAVLGAGYFLVPTILAAMSDCTIDSCRWCYSDECGTPDVLWGSCTANLGSYPTEEDWVVMEAVDEYYCAEPDEYSYCRTTPTMKLVEGCPYGCDPQGLGGACAGPPPTCDPATCETSRPLGNPHCIVRSEDGTSAVVQDFEEQWCEAVEPRGETCVGADVTRVSEECPQGCATTGRSCGSTLELQVYQPASPDTYVPCAACRVRVEGVTGTFTGITMIDGTVAFQGVAAGLYVVSYGCGPESLGPHLPSDLVLHPDEPVTWVLAVGPRMDPDVVLANIVAPAQDQVDVLLGRCG
jgi:hypothetical protein